MKVRTTIAGTRLSARLAVIGMPMVPNPMNPTRSLIRCPFAWSGEGREDQSGSRPSEP